MSSVVAAIGLTTVSDLNKANEDGHLAVPLLILGGPGHDHPSLLAAPIGSSDAAFLPGRCGITRGSGGRLTVSDAKRGAAHIRTP